MEASLSKTSVSCLKKVYCACFSREETAEAVVPDVMPDIGEITCADGTVYLRGKEVAAGRLTLTGTVLATVLYLPEGESCPRRLSIELPYSISAESPALTEQCLASATVRLAYVEARTLNPRKVHVRAGLCVRAACYAPGEIALGTAVPPECGADIHTKTETVSAAPVTGVWEKTFVLTDEYPLPASRAAASELIGQNMELTAEDVKVVGSKLIFKGTAKANLLWYGEDGALNAAAFASGFSQILEIGEVGELADTQIELMLTGAYFELLQSANGGQIVSAELHVLAQAVCAEDIPLEYIADAYSNALQLELCFGASEQLTAERPLTLRDSMRGLVETSFPVREVIQVLADVGPWTAENDGFACPIHVKLLLRDEEGATRGVVRSFSAQFKSEADCGAEIELRAVHCTELYATPAAGGVEVRLLAEAQAAVCTAVTVTPVDSISGDEENPPDLSELPSVVVLPRRDGDLWELAKRYHSTTELIEKANSSLTGSVLLVPRAR